MGLDLLTVPVRLETAGMRAIRESAEAWEAASFRPPFFEDDEYDGPLPRVSREILEHIPDGFEATDHFPDRGFEEVEYLLNLSSERRSGNWEERERSFPYRAVHGDRYFAEHAAGGQGHPWRCSTSGFLAEAAARIDAIDPTMVRRRFSVREMVDAGVYKARLGEDDDVVFERRLAALRSLARYYHRLADNSLDLIVIVY